MLDYTTEHSAFKSYVPEPTETDLAWQKKADKKQLEPTKKLVRSLIERNEVWRLDYLVQQSKEKIVLGDTSAWEFFWYCGNSVDPSVLATGINTVGCENAALYVMENFGTSLHNIALAFQVSRKNKNVTQLYITLIDKICTEDKKKSFLDRVLSAQEIKLLPAFFEAKILDVNDFAINPLLLAVQTKELSLVDLFVQSYNADISLNDYAAIKESARIGAYNIQKYLEAKADVTCIGGGYSQTATVEKNVKKLEHINDNSTADTDLLSTQWRKINDNEILETNSSDDKAVMFTRLFNFAAHEVIYTQYLKDDFYYPPVAVVRNFKDYEEKTILKEAFDELINLKGNPPQDVFKRTVPVDLSR